LVGFHCSAQRGQVPSIAFTCSAKRGPVSSIAFSWSAKRPASGSLAETPQVIYFTILFIDTPDRTNARPARQVDPVQDRDEQEDCLGPQVGPHPVPPRLHYPYRFCVLRRSQSASEWSLQAA
jgi:hypothetical protein